MEPYNERLKRLRNAVRPRLSQAKVAKHFGIAPSSVAQWEGPDRGRPTTDKLVRLARLYQVSLEELCGDDLPLIDPASLESAQLQEPNQATKLDEEIALVGRMWVFLEPPERRVIFTAIEALVRPRADAS